MLRNLEQRIADEDGVTIIFAIQVMAIMTMMVSTVMASSVGLGNTTERDYDSKSALAAEACDLAFGESLDRLQARLGGPEGGLSRLLDSYLSQRHRDRPDDGCPMAAYAAANVNPRSTNTMKTPRLTAGSS